MLSLLLQVFLLLRLASAIGPNPPTQRPSGVVTYTPTGSNLNGTDFALWVNAQKAAGQSQVALASGQYNVTNPYKVLSVTAYINLGNLNGITVWMDNVNITLASNVITGLSITSGTNVTTYGPRVWYDTPGFSQATITQVWDYGNQNYGFEFHLDDGYDPSNMIINGAFNAGYGVEYLDPVNGRLKAGGGYSVFYGGNVTPVSESPGTYRYNYTQSIYADFFPEVGHKLWSRGKMVYCTEVFLGVRNTLNDLIVHNCGGFGLVTLQSRVTHINSYQLMPAPAPPPGGSQLPIRSSAADGIRSYIDYVGPNIDSSLITQLDDDCISILGVISNTSSASGTNQFVGYAGAAVGDVLAFYSTPYYTPMGTATVTATNNTNPYTRALLTVSGLPSEFVAGSTRYTNRNNVGSGFSITNTIFSNNRGAGAKIKASNGLIANNQFIGNSRQGITLGPEFTLWNEGDYVRNVTVSNNQMSDLSYLNAARSVLSVHGDSYWEGSNDTAANPIGANNNIAINGVQISSTGSHSNVYVGAASNITMTNVVINNPLSANYTVLEQTPNGIVNWQNAEFDGTVGICRNGGGSVPGVSGVYVYGQAINAPTTLPNC